MKKLGLLLMVSVALTGCTGTQKGATIGGLAGAGLGAIIGYQSGNAATGALVGAGVGGVGGALAGDAMEEKQDK